MDDTDGGIKYYNGNISTTIIKAGNANTSFRYEYEYDNLNRLVKAWSGEIVRIGVNKNNKYSEEVSYNLNSSPCTLKRKGKMNNGNMTGKESVGRRRPSPARFGIVGALFAIRCCPRLLRCIS